jgi:transposase-like protein
VFKEHPQALQDLIAGDSVAKVAARYGVKAQRVTSGWKYYRGKVGPRKDDAPPADPEATSEARRAAADEQRRKEIDRLRRELAKAGGRIEELEKFLDRYASIKPADMKVPTWLRPKARKSRTHHATPVLMLSDLHLDEVVELAEMDGLNEYNRKIAQERLNTVINNVCELLRTYVAGVEIDGIVVAIIGDIITGAIHEELADTNESPVPATIVHWVPILASALVRLADEFGHVFVPCVDGNHDRTTKKTRKKKRAESSNAWIIYNWLADTLRHDNRITFSITPSPEQVVNVYGTTFLLSHGDSFRSAGGVGGLYPALLKWLLRRKDLYSQKGTPFDYALIGHWHQLLWGRDFVVNGSLKGYDEYAKDGGFGFERPQQALFIVSPENGIVQRMPVFAD